MIRIELNDTINGTITQVEIPSEHGPALKSAIGEIRDRLGGRLAGSHRPAKEAALTRALAAIGDFAQGLSTITTKGDADYE